MRWLRHDRFTRLFGKPSAAVGARAEQIFEQLRDENNAFTSRLFAYLLLLQWIGGIAVALWVSPITWIGTTRSLHLHVYASVWIGGLLALFPCYLAWRNPAESLTRNVVTAAQSLFSVLLIHLSGGRIETHFHVFVSLAFMAFYRDWRAVVIPSAIVAVDHALRGMYFPESVFGVTTASPSRWIEHSGWVIFADIVLVISCRRGMNELRLIALRQAQLEENQAGIERTVEQRTAELQIAMAEARAATECKTAFLANMSHEIRTPMTAILGFTDQLLDPRATQTEKTDAAQTIHRNGEHLLKLINDILDISKVESGNLQVERAPLDVGALLGEIVGLFLERARSRGNELLIEYETPIPRTIQSDSVRLKQVLVNLVGNAVKFTEAGSVRIVARCDAAREMLCIRVIDTGIGIDADAISRLFLPFSQADISTTRRFGGTGLGLAISRAIIEHLGGRIFVKSAPDQGSEFMIEIASGPLAGAEFAAEPPPRAPVADPVPARSNLPAIHGRVLVVEDGVDNQRLVKRILIAAGAEVSIADNGAIGVMLALESRDAGTPFDVILMDMQMPVMDGYSAARKLRDANWEGPIFALTAHAMKGDIEECLRAGCDAYLTKPIHREALVTQVSRACAAQPKPVEVV